ncbi:CNNM domain-containing protein [Pseudidiomarina sp. GXY010]|uniref:CNNM domain-containing protein n=1 Tax=Pseudidiomarina fusca TaxID=2965078 RepID=A0ABU3KYQ7_9GAMM|nr:CNNM domain-containing protein [Pseudidiomarina sp. GXY010]MDT7526063.1 CNNM domain-containing protein [Pseudidiomarina sp. GXY010]
MFLLILFAFIAVGISFLCSILEAALLSITPSYVAQLKAEQPVLHGKLQALKDNIDRPLAAILTLNTVAHTAGAAGVGAQVGVVFGDGYLAIASAVMTVLILVLSEILPKTIGAKFWRQLAPLLPGILNLMILILKPFIWLSDQVTKRIGGEEDVDVRSEIKALATLGEEQKIIDTDERRVISNILDLHTIRVRDVMTPRTVCESVRPDETVSDFLYRVKSMPYSRFPIIDADEVPHGIILRNEALESDTSQSIAELAREAEIVSEMVNVEKLMARLIQQRQHMALVYDEHGTWMGLVTLEDIIETILGQPIMDETDTVPSLRRYAQQRWGKRLKHDNNSVN